jgi:polyisoprenoid-binding protein YceI
MLFKSTKISDIDGENFNLTGDLTIKDVTKEVVFIVENYGEITDPWGNTRVGFSAKTKINRQDFNITWSKTMETGGLIVSDQVNISAELELIKAKQEEASVN